LAAICGPASTRKRPVTEPAIAAELAKLAHLYEDLAWQMSEGRPTEYEAILRMHTLPFFRFLEAGRRNIKTT
jgi:hypothetical protein